MSETDKYIVSQLYIYPVKSLGGIAVNQAEVTSTGFKYDRRYMLVDANNRFISQRECHELCLLNIAFAEDGFIINHKQKDIEPLLIPFSMEEGEVEEVIIWNDKVKAIVAEPKYNQWFTNITGIDCRLVYMSDKYQRPVDANYAIDNDIVSFADGYPILILGEESVNLLNRKLPEPLPINRFRPNIVFKGGTPHIEDTWKKFTINNIELNSAKPCARCMITTINQDNANTGTEPLKTLATYRKRDNNIYFGMNLLPAQSGTINIEDKINISHIIS